MSKQPPDYEKEKAEALRRNRDYVISSLDKNDEGMLLKVENFCAKHNFNRKRVLKLMRTEEYFRAVFAIDPAKQKIHEDTAAEFIESLPQVRDFKQLGHSELALFHGAVMSKKDLKKSGGHSTAKTIDFSWVTKEKQIYTSHKYTRESGGMQDGQYLDLQEFIREANFSDLPNTFFVAIADGDYYKMRDSSANMTKLEYLRKISNQKNVFAMPISELEDWLDKLN